jgi:hypothetical protein
MRGRRNKESISFLKKRNKKLLFVSGGAGDSRLGSCLGATDKSFLVLFFKKELLSCLNSIEVAI